MGSCTCSALLFGGRQWQCCCIASFVLKWGTVGSATVSSAAVEGWRGRRAVLLLEVERGRRLNARALGVHQTGALSP